MRLLRLAGRPSAVPPARAASDASSSSLLVDAAGAASASIVRRTLSSSSSSASASASSIRRQRPIYVAATRQHAGKTSVSLALVSHFARRFGRSNVGYMKAVGQRSLQVHDVDGDELVNIDKDAKLIKDHFRLDHLRYADMSPVLIPRGYTKDYLDGLIDREGQFADVRRAYLNIVQSTGGDNGGGGGGGGGGIAVCEGTGHCGVGSVVGAGNARVAAELGADVVLVANGGVGRTFDELELNRSLCLQYGVNIAGVIVNKVRPDKYDQTRDYLSKAIAQMWTGPNGEPAPPLLGVVPDRPYLGCPALADVESAFGSVLISGSDHRYRHYDVGSNVEGRSIGMSLVTTDLSAFLRAMQRKDGGSERTVYVCHVTRDDVVLGFLGEYRRRARRGLPFQSALIVCTGVDDGTGGWEDEEKAGGYFEDDEDDVQLSPEVCEMIADCGPSGPPVLVAAGCCPSEAARRIRTMTPKFNASDERRVARATEHYEPYIDFDLLLERTSEGTRTGTGAGRTAAVVA
ncbi:hypothetical protein ACHAWF_017624 [Thalassiosira exigua]